MNDNMNTGIAVHAFNVAEDCLWDAKDYGLNDQAYLDLIGSAIDSLRDARRMLYNVTRREGQ